MCGCRNERLHLCEVRLPLNAQVAEHLRGEKDGVEREDGVRHELVRQLDGAMARRQLVGRVDADDGAGDTAHRRAHDRARRKQHDAAQAETQDDLAEPRQTGGDDGVGRRGGRGVHHAPTHRDPVADGNASAHPQDEGGVARRLGPVGRHGVGERQG